MSNYDYFYRQSQRFLKSYGTILSPLTSHLSPLTSHLSPLIPSHLNDAVIRLSHILIDGD